MKFNFSALSTKDTTQKINFVFPSSHKSFTQDMYRQTKKHLGGTSVHTSLQFAKTLSEA